MKNQDNNTSINVLVHLLGLFTGFVGALIIYLISSQKGTKEHAKNALNWQLSLVLYIVIVGILIVLTVILAGIEDQMASTASLVLILIIFLLIFILMTLDFIFCIIGSAKAGNNEYWKYPLSIKFLK